MKPGMTSGDLLGRLGVWVSRGSLTPGQAGQLAALAEDLGYGAFWISGGAAPGTFEAVQEALLATSRIVVATGVINIWIDTPQTVTAGWHDAEAAAPGRLVVGLGVSHAPLVAARGLGEYARPLELMAGYLDALDSAPDPLPPGRRLLGALGPKMLRLAAQRSLGAHPYLVTPGHTSQARAQLGPALLAPEQTILVDADPARARATARQFLARYFGMPNYTRNWLRTGGLEPADIAGGGSDRLVDSLVAWGDGPAIAAAVTAHWAHGADHVCVQALGPLDRVRLAWAEVAAALPSSDRSQ